MKILDQYIARTVCLSILSILGALVAIFTFFEFIEELDDLGQGKYGLLQAAEFVFFRIPRQAYELFPVAALVGSLLGLGSLVNNNEITVIRAAGVSLGRIIRAVMIAGFIIMAGAVLLGEFIAPPSEQLAQHRRSIATTDRIALKGRGGFWARDGQSFVNIRQVLPGNRIKNIYIYEFDDDNRLTVSSRAKEAHYENGQWILRNIEQTLFMPERITKREIKLAQWESMLDPKLISLVVIRPDSLSMGDLYKYIRFLSQNEQNSQQYEQAFWHKIIYPVATVVMVFLSIPIVLGTSHASGVGQRIVLGALIGLVFQIANKAAANLGMVYDLQPALCVVLPTFLTFAAGLLLMQRLS
jgi:lipopolysaccharide export system permease protein